MIQVYFVQNKHNDPLTGSCIGLFCEKNYWDQNRYIDDGSSGKYETITDAFESEDIEVVTDGEINWEGKSVDEIVAGLKEHGIELIVDDIKFITEYKAVFGTDPRD